MAQSKKSYTSSNMWVWYVLGLLALLGVFLYIRNWMKQKKQSQEQEPEIETEPEITPDSDALINFYMKCNEVIKEHYGNEDSIKAALLTAQASHETGEFTSAIFKENLNAFGMRNPKVRETTSMGEKNTYAYYKSIEDSILDRLLWDDHNRVSYDNIDVTKFVQQIYKLGYFTDSFLNYKNAVVKWYKIVQSEISRG